MRILKSRVLPASLGLLVAILCVGVLAFQGGVSAQANCAVTNRGWLTAGADRGVHPVGLFGPLGLHGEHKMLNDFSNSGVSLRVSEVLSGDLPEGEMAQTGSPSYDPFKVGGNGDLQPIRYYPGRKYRITITCANICTFLGSVEKGTREDSFTETNVDTRAALQIGTLDTAGESSIKLYKGITDYTSITNDMTATIGSTYTFFWTAPNFTEISYGDLKVRTTIVQDKTATCEGKFYQYSLDSLLTCGDGIKDALEECDDGNTSSGDGCSENCTVEVGYTCDKYEDVPSTSYKKSVCTKAEVLLDVSSLTVTEGQETSYTVKLSTTVEAGKEVFVSIMGVGSEIALSKSSLRFDSANAQIAQPILVNINDNFLRDENRELTIKHIVSSTDENFASITIPDLKVNVVDDDVAELKFSTNELTVVEDGSAGEFTVSITAQPYETVIVELSASPANQLILNPSQLVFFANDWNVAKKVSVIAIDNQVVEGFTDVKITPVIRATKDQAYEALNSQAGLEVLVHVEDNDLPGLIVTPTSLEIIEGSTESFYYVSLRSQMKADTKVTVNLETSCGSTSCGFHALSVEGTNSLEFNETDWSTQKKVYVKYDENNAVEWRTYKSMAGNKTFTVDHKVASADPLFANLKDTSVLYPYTVTVKVTDNDVPGVSHPEIVTLEEGGQGFQFPMKLMSMPLYPVTVKMQLSSDSTGVKIQSSHDGGRDDSDYYREVTWAPSEWNDTKEVTLVATYDDSIHLTDFEIDMQLTSRSSDTYYDYVLSKTITVQVTDNDKAKVMRSKIGYTGILTVTEGDSADASNQGQFSLFLNSKPSTDVKLTLKPSSQLTVSPETLVFTSTTWSMKQVVTVTAVDDTDVELPEHGGLIRFEIESTDPMYKDLKMEDEIVNIKENDFMEVEREVGPWGGMISPTYPSGSVTLNIPGGVLNTTVNLKIGETQKPLGDVLGVKETVSESSNEYRRLSGTYSFEPHGTTFSLPVYITLHYSQAAYDTEHKDNTTRLVFLKKENESAPWKVVPGGKFGSGIATMAITSFSSYKVAIEKVNTAQSVGDSASGLQGQDIAKCINGFQLTVDDNGQPTFKFDDQVEQTNIVQVTVTNNDEYRISILVIILLAALGLQSFVVVGLIISLNTKKQAFTYGGMGSNAIVPVEAPSIGAVTASKMDDHDSII